MSGFAVVVIATLLVAAVGTALAVYVVRAHTRPLADTQWSPPDWVLLLGAWSAIALSVLRDPHNMREDSR